MQKQNKAQEQIQKLGVSAEKLFQRIKVRMKVHNIIMHWKKLSKRSLNRKNRIQEWVKTQKLYIQDLNIIVNQIQTPLRQKNLISANQQRIIFPNMKGLILLSQQMHDTMKAFLDKWDPLKTVIAPAVIKLSSFFKIYIEYFNNYLKGKQILDKIREKPEFIAIQKKLKMDFESYLSKPTQRPVKYKLLLTDYHKKLRSDHPDFNSLTEAIKVYHNVVQKTNLALQNQKKTKRIIQIQAKYKNIIQSSRQWKNQYEAKILNQSCKIFLFTDLLLIAIQKGLFLKDQLVTKIYLNGASFCEATQDGLYYKNKLLVCGTNGVANFLFQQKQVRDKAFQQIYQTISQLFNNQDKRRQAISRYSSGRFQTQRLSKPYFNPINFVQYQTSTVLYKSIKISVLTVEKRYIQKYQKLYFVLKLQLSFPEVINHKSIVSYQRLVLLENIVRKIYPSLTFQSITQLPKQVPNEPSILYQTRTIQHRSILIQIFLNILFRRAEAARSLNIVCNRINMMECFFQFLTFQYHHCICNICQNGDIINSIQKYNEQKQKRLEEKNNKLQKERENLCIFRTFHTQNKVASVRIKQSRYNLSDILLYINCKLGNINHQLTNRIIQFRSYKVKIHFFSVQSFEKDKQNSSFIEIILYRNDRVADVLQMLKRQLKIDFIMDFKLVLINSQTQFLLSDQQLIVDLIGEAQLKDQFTNNKQEKTKGNFFTNFINQKIQQLKQWKKPTGKLFLKKVIVFEKEVQMQALLGSKKRAELIINEIFYKFKIQQLMLPTKQSIKTLSALYCCLKKLKEFQNIKRTDIKKEILQQVLPKSKIKNINQKNLTQIYEVIYLFQQKKIYNIQIFQKMVLKLVSDSQGWKTCYFNIQNVYPKSLPSGQKNLRLGINFQQLSIIRQITLTKMLKFNLSNLAIILGGGTLLIKGQKDYIFNCKNMYGIKFLLQTYEAYNLYFLGKTKNNHIQLMEETF